MYTAKVCKALETVRLEERIASWTSDWNGMHLHVHTSITQYNTISEAIKDSPLIRQAQG